MTLEIQTSKLVFYAMPTRAQSLDISREKTDVRNYNPIVETDMEVKEDDWRKLRMIDAQLAFRHKHLEKLLHTTHTKAERIGEDLVTVEQRYSKHRYYKNCLYIALIPLILAITFMITLWLT